MKLYAKVSSERATKGQGGNKFLDIQLMYEWENERVFYGSITLNSDGVLTFITPKGKINTIATLHEIGITTKGEKQKTA